ncbi:MAG: hypothetical protein ACRCVW_03280 [Brevinema sp.]
MNKNNNRKCFFILLLCFIFTSCNIQDEDFHQRDRTPILTRESSLLPTELSSHILHGEFTEYQSYGGHQIEEIVWNAAHSYYTKGSTSHYPIFLDRVLQDKQIYRDTSQHPWKEGAIIGIGEDLNYLLYLDNNYQGKKIIGLKQNWQHSNWVDFYVQTNIMTFYVQEHNNGFFWLKGIDMTTKRENGLSLLYFAPIHQYLNNHINETDYKKALPKFRKAVDMMNQVFILSFYSKDDYKFNIYLYQDKYYHDKQ